jgi:hypothetical protein
MNKSFSGDPVILRKPITAMKTAGLVALSLSAWFGPFVPYLYVFILSAGAKGPRLLDTMLFVAALPGMGPALLFARALGLKLQGLGICHAFGLALPAGLALLVLRAPRWRLPLLAGELILAVAMSGYTFWYLRNNP